MKVKHLSLCLLTSVLATTATTAQAKLTDFLNFDKTKRNQIENIDTLQGLLEYQDRSAKEKKAALTAVAQQARIDSLTSYAYSVAIKASMAKQLQLINQTIDANSRQLDAIYNFEPLMIKSRVVPPVITEARDIYTQDSNRQILLSGAVFDIYEQARFSSTAPNWREYLQFSSIGDVYDIIVYGSVGLEPETKEEKAAWVNASKKGWEDGVTQANALLQAAMDNLNRDYTGMLRFHTFVAQGKLTMPVINSYNLYDTNTGERLVLDEKMLQIEQLPEFVQAKERSINMNGYNYLATTPVQPKITPVVHYQPVPLEKAQDAVTQENGGAAVHSVVKRFEEDKPVLQDDYAVDIEKSAIPTNVLNSLPNVQIKRTYTLVHTPYTVTKPAVQGINQNDLPNAQNVEYSLEEQIELQNYEALPKKEYSFEPVSRKEDRKAHKAEALENTVQEVPAVQLEQDTAHSDTPAVQVEPTAEGAGEKEVKPYDFLLNRTR